MNSKNKFRLLLLALVALSATNIQAQIQNFPGLKLFVPLGFDSDDEVEIVSWGQLPTSCLSRPHYQLRKNGNTIKVDLMAELNVSPGLTCLPTGIDFLETIPLGVLAEGSYNLLMNENTAYQYVTQFKVDKTESTNVDNYHYANVTKITYNSEFNFYNLEGTNPNDCYELDEIKIISNHKNVYAILPILKQFDDEKETDELSGCDGNPKKFKYPIVLPNELTEDFILLHVRSLDGKSVNKVIKNIN